jgi:Na+-driven multidrug efflux pump
MKYKSVFGSILSLAWPTVIEQAMQVAVQYIDGAMVGTVGVTALAAVGVTNTMTWLVNSPLWAFGTGFLACIARDMGAGEVAHARRTLRLGLSSAAATA